MLFRSQVVIEQQTITNKLVEYQTHHTSKELQQILLLEAETKDTLYLTPLLEQDLNVLELQKDSSTVIQMKPKIHLFGLTNTVGTTLCLTKRNSKIPK